MFFVLLLLSSVMRQDSPAIEPWWDQKVATSLKRVPGRQNDWQRVLGTTRPDHRAGMAYLMGDLPLRDLEELPPETLRENVSLAYQARPWCPGANSCQRRSSSMPCFRMSA